MTFCQGNFALMPEVIDGTTSIPDLIREFGTEKIPFVHFRDVKGTVDDFQETFHDAGQTDMPACMEAYYDIGFAGAMRPDHVPTLAGELNTRPATRRSAGSSRSATSAGWSSRRTGIPRRVMSESADRRRDRGSRRSAREENGCQFA